MSDELKNNLVDSAYLENFVENKRSRRWFQQLAKEGIVAAEKVKGAYKFNPVGAIKQIMIYLIEQADSYNQTQKDVDLEKQKLQAEVDLKKSKARLAKIELDEIEGKMIRSEDVEAVTTDLIYTICSMMIALPGRLAVDMVGASTAAEVSNLIRSEVYKILEELSNYKYDPEVYAQRVRDRQGWSELMSNEPDDS